MLLVVPLPLAALEITPVADQTPEQGRLESLFPQPVQIQEAEGAWSVPPGVLVDWGTVPGPERNDLADRLDRVLFPVGRTWKEAGSRDDADLRFSASGTPGEGYALTVGPGGVAVQAAEASGRFYALVTLGQLLPPRARSAEPVLAASVAIHDEPAFSWRGLMLDSARHFQSVSTLETVLELMALHKLNRFHWHLTDDQAWRLEVPGWPRLTSVGAWRAEVDGRPYGGFYSVDEVRRIVAYAARRHIIVVPEIEVPGHASAALAAYPELSASGLPRDVPLDWGVADGVLSIGRASVRRFTTDVLATLTQLFPGPWIHWGGDETFRSPWMRNAESLAWMKSVKASTADQALAAFWSDLARRTLAAGRVPLGWDETALFALPEGTVVQWWDTSPRPLTALKAGHPLIVSWKEALYLDYPELDSDGDRAWWMPVQTLERIARTPLLPPGAPGSARPLILGLEASLFTERAPQERLGRKLFPRLSLVAEIAWRAVPGGVPDWEDRLRAHRSRLEAWGVGMPPPPR